VTYKSRAVGGSFSISAKHRIMPAEPQDVQTSAPPSGSAPSGDATSSGSTSGEQALSPGGVTTQPENVTTQEGAAGTGPTVPEYFKDIPTAEELRQQAENKVPYAAGLANLRTVLETLQPQYDQLKTQHEPWQPVLEKYETPQAFQSAFEAGRGLFTETGQLDPDTQLPLRTAVPNLLKLGQESFGDFLRLAEDVMTGVTLDGRPMIYHGLEKLGLNPEHVEQYKTWEREGFSPQATGLSEEDRALVDSIPPNLKGAFEKAPPNVQKDYLLMDEETRNYHLARDQRDLDRQQSEETQRQQEQVRFNQDIQTTSQTERATNFGTSYGQLIEGLKPWQPTGDADTDTLYHHAIAQLLTNVFDSQMNADPSLPFSVVPILQQIAPDVDVKTLAAQADEWDKQRDLAVRYEAFNKREQGRYQAEATRARSEANRTFRNLSAKMNALAKRVTERLSGVKAEGEAADLAAGAAQGRPRIPGAPNGNQSPQSTGQYNQDWRKQYYAS
jgi:hypothetical protein